MKIPIIWDKILLPRPSVDLYKWAVVACDQYTSNSGYWERLDKEIGDSPSTLKLILPEVFLGKNDETRSDEIAKIMRKYVSEGLFDEVDEGVIVIERTTPPLLKSGQSKKRHGIMLVVDLEAYSFKHEDKALIRATEGTVVERVPPRADVRIKCDLELPHIMLLVDDPNLTLIEPLVKSDGYPLYDTELNGGGGRVRGKLVKGRESVERALKSLIDESIKKYGEPFLFGVGDGNHSLAAAKATFKKNKYALVEVVNIYDEGLNFEPIHRLVVGGNPKELVAALISKFGETNTKSNLIFGKQKVCLNFPKDAIKTVAEVQEILDVFVGIHGGIIDYIHGEGELEELCEKSEDNVGIFLPSMDKSQLFDYVVKNGALPRKTFSMGEAYEKRYYLEARKIVTDV